MFFQPRELPPYAKTVSANELEEGAVYFELSYAPETMVIPFVGTLRFVGKDLHTCDVGLWYFREVRADRSVEDASEYEESFGREEGELNATFEFEQALDGLLWCSLRRKKLDAQEQMHFQGKELRPDAEPLSLNQLQDGSVYFALNYDDDAGLIPVIITFVFIGTNLQDGDHGKAYFQDYYSYGEGFRYASPNKPDWATFYIRSETEVNDVFEFDQMLDELMRCSLRRQH